MKLFSPSEVRTIFLFISVSSLSLILSNALTELEEPKICLAGSIPHFQEENRCFTYNMRSLTFEEAAANATQLGGFLASIHNAFENSLVLDTAKRQPHYIGAICFSNNTCAWLDGSPFNFTAYAPGSPTFSNGACLLHDAQNKWHSEPCSGRHPSVAMIVMPTPLYDKDYARMVAFPLATLPLQGNPQIRACLTNRNYSGGDAIISAVGCDPFNKNDPLVMCLYVAARGIVGSNKENRVLFLFRPTNSFIEGIFEDFTYELTDFVIDETGEVFGRAELFFNSAFKNMWTDKLREFVKTMTPNEIVEISAYSLGAPIAFLFSIYVERLYGDFANRTEKFYVFGAPRATDPFLAEYHSTKFGNYFRTVHNADLIARVPINVDGNIYAHRRSEAFFREDMSVNATFTVCAAAESHFCSYGFVEDEPTMLSDHHTYYNFDDPQDVGCFV